MTASPEKCSKCYLPKNPQGSGSLTQWLSSCSCDRQQVLPADTNTETPIELCKICGKRSREGRVGSFTQFIFRYDLCACESSAFPDRAAKLQPVELPAFDPRDPFDDSEEEVTVDATEFPIERYKPILFSGKGASGSVYVCRDRLLNKKVAIKVLHRLSKEDIIAFQREAQVLSKLEHPTIVKLMDFGVTGGGSPYMVLEYTAGVSLKTKLDEDGPLTWSETRAVFAHLAAGLIYCHDRKVYHRDLKPENILFVTQEEGYAVKLIDFGIAFVKPDRADNSSNSGMSLAGTPAYMAPDQALGIEYDARSELYSFGCVVYEALTGRPPFTADSALEVISMHANMTPPPLSDVTDTDTRQAEAFLSKCLAKKPGDRFFSMKRVHEALVKADVESRIQTAAEKDSSLQEGSGRIPLTSAIPPAVQQNGLNSKIALSIVVLIALGVGAAEVFQLFRNNNKVESKPIPVLKAESESPTGREPFALERTGKPGLYTASGFIGKDAFKEIAASNRVRRLQISPSAEVEWQSLPLLYDTRINELNLNFTKIGDESIAFLTPLLYVRNLNLSETKITDEGVKTLVSIRHLRILALSNTAVTGACLKDVAKIRGLTNLFISGIHKITPDDLYYLRGKRLLDRLDISVNPIGDEGAKVLGRLKITRLEIDDCSLTDTGIGYLSHAPIMSLSIGANPKLTDRALLTLESFKDLRHLKIAGLPNLTKNAIAKFKANRPDVLLVEDTSYAIRGNKLEEMIDTVNEDRLFEKLDPKASSSSY
ncbi:MAG: protein kinase [Candidatus Melainabacteria bacterium]|mgnify:CR=1 FL=1|nr:protein kinase [Candidatus Melainabacteria bacterium]